MHDLMPYLEYIKKILYINKSRTKKLIRYQFIIFVLSTMLTPSPFPRTCARKATTALPVNLRLPTACMARLVNGNYNNVLGRQCSSSCSYRRVMGRMWRAPSMD